ncbi:MAG TPA: hypothetical protein VGS20_12150 [Candidatus Acidoferrales bacterium]|nr:hypothetical protein [Candidatus Acidoferrales bacterium]
MEFFTLIVITVYAGIAYRQWEEMRKATNAASQSADAAANAAGTARDSLKASIDQFNLDQRAWIGVPSVAPPQYSEGGTPVYVKEGERAVFQVNVLNSGRTPALDVSFRAAYTVLPKGSAFSARYPRPISSISSRTVIQPEQAYNLPTGPSSGVLSHAFIDAIKNGSEVLYVFGEVGYDDVFFPKTKRRMTHYCIFLQQDLATFSPCSKYNEAN